MKILLVFSNTGRGLRRDACLLKKIIETQGHTVSIAPFPPAGRYRRRILHLYNRSKILLVPSAIKRPFETIEHQIRRIVVLNFPLIVHLQNIYPGYINRTSRNWLIPNQEWFDPERIKYLADMQTILCKSRHAMHIFKKLHPDAVYAGFSGAIQTGSNVGKNKDFRSFLHVAGNSKAKGTKAIVDVWKRHPEYPRLNIVINDKTRLGDIPGNIEVFENISDAGITRLWQQAGVVIAPSEAEGFGHTLLEGMAYGAAVITVNAPPMNELVTSERGYLAPWSHSAPCRLGTRYFVDVDGLEGVINRVVQAPVEELAAKSAAARKWVICNHDAFTKRFCKLLEAVENQRRNN
ncbi:MAG: glycosyltransferase [Desulfobacterales bacterium]